MKNDPWAYLHRTGLVKGVTKSMEAGRAVPERGSPPMSTPMPNERKLKVKVDAQRVQRPAEFKQPDPPMTAKRKTAATANIEGNESAKYEKMEKRSMRGLKGGGTEKEMRAGHNTKGAIAKKTEHMIHEGKDPKQAYAIANSMERAGRLTKEGGYKRVGKKKKGK